MARKPDLRSRPRTGKSILPLSRCRIPIRKRYMPSSACSSAQKFYGQAPTGETRAASNAVAGKIMPTVSSELETKVSEAREAVANATALPGPACVTCSFQAEDMVLVHLVRERQQDVPVLFLETGYHFS